MANVTMTAPGPSMGLTAQSGNTYISSAASLITGVNPSDVPSLLAQGCTSSGSSGSGSGWKAPVIKTANYQLLSDDALGGQFNNAGAAGEVDFTLPAIDLSKAQNCAFFVATAQTLKIIAPASVTIANGGDVSAAAGNIAAATVGNYLELYPVSATQWGTRNITGDWTIT